MLGCLQTKDLTAVHRFPIEKLERSREQRERQDPEALEDGDRHEHEEEDPLNAARQHRTLSGFVMTLLVVLVSCGSGQRDQSGDATEETAPTAPATTAAVIPPATVIGAGDCPSGVGSGPVDADQAVGCLERAWKEANRSAGETVASVDVVDALFADRWSSPGGVLRPCAPEPNTEAMTCRYEYQGAVHRFQVRRSEGGWRVTQFQKAS